MEQEEQITIQNIIDELKSMNESSCFIVETKEKTDEHEQVIKKEPIVRTQLTTKEKTFYKSVGDHLLSDVQNVIEEHIEAVSWVDRMKASFSKTTHVIADAIDTGYNMFKSFFFPNGFSWIDAVLSSILALEIVYISFRKGIHRRVSQIIVFIKKSVDWLDENVTLSPETKKKFSKVKGGIMEILAKMWEETKKLYDDIKPLFSSVYNSITGLVKEIFSGSIDLGLYATDLISTLVLSVYGNIIKHFWYVISEWGLSMFESIFGDSYKRYGTPSKKEVKKVENVSDMLSNSVLVGDIKQAQADKVKIRQQQELEMAKELTNIIAPTYLVTEYDYEGNQIQERHSTKDTVAYLLVAPNLIISSKQNKAVLYGQIEISKKSEQQRDRFIAAVNASYDSMQMMSFEEFKRLVPDGSRHEEAVRKMWQQYQDNMETRRLGDELNNNKISDRRNAVLQRYLNNAQVKRFYTDTEVDIYYGKYNTGTAIEDDLTQLANGNLSLGDYLTDTIKYFFEQKQWSNIFKTLSDSLDENISRFISSHHPTIAVDSSNDAIQVNNISAVNPTGGNELTNACRVVQLTEYQMEDALEKQENLLDVVYTKYDDFISSFNKLTWT